MKKIINILIIIIINISLVISCASTKLSISKSSNQFNIKTIALMPGGGVLADSVGIELLKYDFNIIDTSTFSSIMIRNNIREVEITLPTNLGILKDNGIDALLNLRLVVGYDGKPQSAVFRLIDTKNGFVINGGTWQNAKGGAMGSIADAIMRKDLTDASIEIARGLAKSLK